jgi:prolyl oligopeptidase
MSAVAQGGTIEVIHGVEVRDPYRWLEDRQLPDTEEWINRQQQLCAQYFLRNEFYSPLKQIVAETLAVEVIDQAARAGERVFLRKQVSGQEQAAIWVRSAVETEDNLLVDPATLGSNISIGILRISSDGSLLAYSVRSSGSDAAEVRVVNVETGETLPEHLALSYVRSFTFATQGKGFYYCTEPVDGVETLSVKHHQLGESPSSDVALFSVPWAKHRRLALLSNCGTLAAVVSEFAGAKMVHELYITTENSSSDWNALYTGVCGRLWPILARGQVFLLDRENARNGQIVGFRVGDKSIRVIVPEGSNPIQKCLVTQEGFLVTYLVDRKSRVERWSAEGAFMEILDLPSGGSIEVLPSYSEQSSSLYFLHESYTEAPSLSEIDLTKEQCAEPIQWTVTDEKSHASVRELWYTSRDGTQIPVSLLEPIKKRFPGPQPVILSAYGGFGAAEVPRYSRFAKIMAELGVTIAKPSIRGGSEFGEDWHKAATKRQKQTAIDDFLAAAEWLCSEDITDERHLAIMGASNGGLLVAAAAMQRPDLFKAVICTGPLTDMLRYERFDHASKWRDEYGTVEDAEDFQALLSYSPYHNVKDTADYPAMLFVTGDADDRCNPAHARKMVAVLQERAAQRQLVIVDYAKRWGHLPTLSLTERIEALVRKIAFLCDQLDIALPGDSQ